MTVCRCLLLSIAVALLAACETAPRSESTVGPGHFELESLAKGDTDMIAEITISQSLRHLKELARKLYVRNPNQWRRGGHANAELAMDALFGPHRLYALPDLHGARTGAAINLAFDDAFPGDRVAAFVEGMRTMLIDGYGGKSRFYLTDQLDPQRLHYLARNFEVAFWKLSHDLDPKGERYLLSNSLEGNGDLSFERLAGKLIALQDAMAQIIADSTNRHIKNVIQSVASAVFFPL